MEINFEDWKKLDLRTATIKEVKDHPEADKLLVLKVDLGTEQRTLVAGLKQYYKKKDLIGKKVIIFTNLKPIELRGIKSEGMVLAAVKGDKVKLLTVDGGFDNGARIE
jgi:methionyl-tRNA synthetase